jgi:hypothetical protein
MPKLQSLERNSIQRIQTGLSPFAIFQQHLQVIVLFLQQCFNGKSPSRLKGSTVSKHHRYGNISLPFATSCVQIKGSPTSSFFSFLNEAQHLLFWIRKDTRVIVFLAKTVEQRDDRALPCLLLGPHHVHVVRCRTRETVAPVCTCTARPTCSIIQ